MTKKNKTLKEYIFTDGWHSVTMGMSKQELLWQEREHGKLVTVKIVF